MKLKYLIIAMLFQSISQPLLAQSSSWMIGYELNQIQGDYGQGIQIASPSFLNDALVIKLRGNQRFLSYDLNGKNKISDHYTISLGFANRPTMIGDIIGVYAEGGAMIILPNDKFSGSDQEWAGYGLFGFNFYFNPNFSYFIEAGAIGSEARAERSDNQRIYNNGFLINVGFKIHFGKSKE